MDSLVDALIKAGALGFFGTLITVAVNWAKDLNTTSRRIRVLDETTKRIAFWEAWGNSKGPGPGKGGEPETESVRAKIACEAEEAAKMVDAMYSGLRPSHVHPAEGSHSRARRWLLLYPPPKLRAWVPRLLFFTSVVSLVLVPTLNASTIREGMEAIIGCLFWTAVFRFLAVWAER
jgi:hypothetical protein